MIVINDATAPKEYEFKYNLPKGYELMTAEEYYGKETEENAGNRSRNMRIQPVSQRAPYPA